MSAETGYHLGGCEKKISNYFKAEKDIDVKLEYIKKTGEGKLTVIGRGKVGEKEVHGQILFTFTHKPMEADESLVCIETPTQKKYFSFYTGGPSSFDCWSMGNKITCHEEKEATLENSWLTEPEIVFTSKKIEFVMP